MANIRTKTLRCAVCGQSSSQQVVLPSALSHTADYLALPVELVVVVVRRKVA